MMAAPLAGVLATLIVSVPVGTGVGALVAEGVGRLQVRLGLLGAAGVHMLWPAPCHTERVTVPGLQVVHECWPSLVLYVPAGHCVH